MMKKQRNNPDTLWLFSVMMSVMLTVLFVALKLTGAIDWSWWWVIFPTPISIAIGCVIVTLTIAYDIWKD